MPGKPDLAILIADKAVKGKGDDKKKSNVFDEMASDMLTAVKEGDKDLLAKILEAASRGVS